MEEAQPSEIAQGGYIHLPDRTKMKRHYMKKLGVCMIYSVWKTKYDFLIGLEN